MKSKIINKLTSRKFWVAVVGFVTPLVIAFGASETTATEIAGIIMSGASVIAYIIGEGLVDSKQNGGE
ncbi:MAG: hypothetical protein IKU25_03020 [Clostridia bacterium]|nr:hypothetical protein [Clostridia bacterium]